MIPEISCGIMLTMPETMPENLIPYYADQLSCNLEERYIRLLRTRYEHNWSIEARISGFLDGIEPQVYTALQELHYLYGANILIDLGIRFSEPPSFKLSEALIHRLNELGAEVDHDIYPKLTETMKHTLIELGAEMDHDICPEQGGMIIAYPMDNAWGKRVPEMRCELFGRLPDMPEAISLADERWFNNKQATIQPLNMISWLLQDVVEAFVDRVVPSTAILKELRDKRGAEICLLVTTCFGLSQPGWTYENGLLQKLEMLGVQIDAQVHPFMLESPPA